jgi:hypothetical protein
MTEAKRAEHAAQVTEIALAKQVHGPKFKSQYCKKKYILLKPNPSTIQYLRKLRDLEGQR